MASRQARRWPRLLLLERDEKLNWNGARAILSSSARKPDSSTAAEAFGAGIVDAAGALSAPP